MAINSPYKTLKDIRDAVIVDSKAGSTSDSNLTDRVDRFINEGYQDLITRRKREWLDEDYFFVMDEKVVAPASITNGSTTVTFTSSTVPTQVTGYSYKVYFGGTDTIYEVASIGSSTLTLASALIEPTDTATTATIVQSGVTLSESVKTIYQVDHDKYSKLVDLRGTLDFKERAQWEPQRTGYAEIATTSGVDSSAAQQLLVYPYVDKAYTLKVHASNYFTELSSDDSEPLIPTEYRQILYHYAIARVYATISRSTELFTEADGRYKMWLARLDTEVKPAETGPSLVYDRSVRFANPFRKFRNNNRYEPED